jgi:hypothetical protein
MNLFLTLVVIAGTYGLACLLLSALGRASEERKPGASVGDHHADVGPLPRDSYAR